ncbi:MAG: hypothetical protein JWQ77_489 [Jatrophihabitans sp.]|nr:hypothetical protein [Jatrophihabitans sp.]
MPSELPELARAQHHWIVLLALPGKAAGLALVALLVAAVIWPWPFLVLFLLVIVAAAALRWQTWRAELIILTTRRIVRVRGVPETTSSEASLRIDRVSGARLVQTVPGKILNYATIELEAPGDHPDVRHLVRIAEPMHFYEQLRRIIFAGEGGFDPDDQGPAAVVPQEFATEPLPRGFFRPRDDR